MKLPDHVRYVIVGAGIHGLSTAWHLADALTERGEGSGADVVVIDKTEVGAGASGIACGVVRNNYFQPGMRELMAHSVSVWESDPSAFSYHPVGYLQISCEAMRADVAGIHAEQQAIGYPSILVEGADESRRYLEAIFPDWRARNITSVLHETAGGYANNQASLGGLAAKAVRAGVRIMAGIEVTAVTRRDGRGTVLETTAGSIGCDHLVVAVGPWVRDLWRMLHLPDTVTVRDQHGTVADRAMWTYWSLQEGTLAVDPSFLTAASGAMPPVVHVDTDAPLYDDADGSLVTDRMWGIYFKPDTNFGGVQGGAMPFIVDRDADEVAVDPYGPASPDFVVGADFARMWTAGLSHCLARFEGKRGLFSREPSGGIGCFTPDSFPVLDTFGDAYVIADSNHGYKMIGLGALVARELLGETQPLLEPFRFSRYAEGRLHPVSHSPFPWS